MKKKKKEIKKEILRGTLKKRTPAGLILLFCLCLWFLLAVPLLGITIRGTVNVHSKYFGRSLDEKKTVIEGSFYEFMRFCSENIPEDARIFFHTRKENYLKFYPSEKAVLYREAHKQKSGYYLYPRKVYAGLKQVPEDADYIIVMLGSEKCDGFRITAKFTPDAYILKREK